MQTKNDIVTLCETCVCQPVCDIYCAIGPVGYCRHYCAEPVRAVWKLMNEGRATCSHCNFTQACVWDYDTFQKFCGVCGAKMGLEKESD